MLITNEHPNTKYENAGKLLDPKLLNAAGCAKDNIDKALVKIDQTRSIRLAKENDKLKKVVKCLVEKNSNKKEHLLCTCRLL